MKRKIRTFLAALTALLMLSQGISAAAAGTEQNKPHETTDTLGAVASVSKVFVTAAAMQLADEGKLELDAPVTEYLPEFRMADARYKDITVRMLMNHRSGLMGSYYSDCMVYDDRSRTPHDDFLKHLSTERLKADPGAFGAYCNDGFELLEQVVEAVSGEDFTDYIEKHICKPLNMQQTGTVWNAFRTDERIRIFDSLDNWLFSGFFREYPGEYGLTIGEGGVLSTAPELCRFGTAFFTGNTTLLSDKAKKEMTKSYALDKYEDGFGLGWDSVQQDEYQAAGVQVVSKGGDLQHQHAELLVAPDEQISISILTSGADSSAAKRMAKALMDIALEEKGISVSRSEPKQAQTVDTVPEEYLKYEGIYADNGAFYRLTFPKKQYMQIESLTDRIPMKQQFLYTTEGRFMKMYGKIESGRAVQASDMMTVEFCEQNGNVYLAGEMYDENGTLGKERTIGYYLQKIAENPVSAEIQQAWDARSHKTYYLYGERYSSVLFNEAISYEVVLTDEAPGYACAGNCFRITGKNNGEAILHMPSSRSRDLTDMEFYEENGAEIMHLTAMGMTYISEDAIPELPDDLKEVKLTTGAAAWYNIGKAAGRNLTLEIPEHAAVYVYDARDRVVYSSYLKGYGNRIPLPENGKIVFLGETGATIGIK